MAKMKPADDTPNYVAPKPGYNSVDRDGKWFLSKAAFPIEDPTNAGKGPLTRFAPQSYTQATLTNFVKGQWAAGALVMLSGDPRDEGTKEVPYEDKPAAPAPTSAPVANTSSQGFNQQQKK